MAKIQRPGSRPKPSSVPGNSAPVPRQEEHGTEEREVRDPLEAFHDRVLKLYDQWDAVLEKMATKKIADQSDIDALPKLKGQIESAEAHSQGIETLDKTKPLLGALREHLDAALAAHGNKQLVPLADRAAEQKKARLADIAQRQELARVKAVERAAAEEAQRVAAEELARQESESGELSAEDFADVESADSFREKFDPQEARDLWEDFLVNAWRRMNGMMNELRFYTSKAEAEKHLVEYRGWLKEDRASYESGVAYARTLGVDPTKLVVWSDMKTRLDRNDALYQALEKRVNNLDAELADIRRRAGNPEYLLKDFNARILAASEDIGSVKALPLTTPSERMAARFRWEGVKRSFFLYNKQWKEKVELYLSRQRELPEVWQQLKQEHAAVHAQYGELKAEMAPLDASWNTDWKEDVTSLERSLAVLPAEIVAAGQLTGDERKKTLGDLDGRLQALWDHWNFVRARPLADADEKQGKHIADQLQKVQWNLDRLLDQRQPRRNQQSQELRQLEQEAVGAWGVWNEGTDPKERLQFLLRIARPGTDEAPILEDSPEFTKFVADKGLLYELMHPIQKVIEQLEKRQAEEEAKQNLVAKRKGLRHPWLAHVKSERWDCVQRALAASCWKKDAEGKLVGSEEDRRRLVMFGSAPAGHNVTDFVGDVPAFRAFAKEYSALSQSVRTTEDRLMAGETEIAPLVEKDVIVKELEAFRPLADAESRAMIPLIALPDWKENIPRWKRMKLVWDYSRDPDALKGKLANIANHKDLLDTWEAAADPQRRKRTYITALLERNADAKKELLSLDSDVELPGAFLTKAERNARHRALQKQRASHGEYEEEERRLQADEIRQEEELEGQRQQTVREKFRDLSAFLSDDRFWIAGPRAVSPMKRQSVVSAFLRGTRYWVRNASPEGVRSDRLSDFLRLASFVTFEDAQESIAEVRARYSLPITAESILAAGAPVEARVEAAPVAVIERPVMARVETRPVVETRVVKAPVEEIPAPSATPESPEVRAEMVAGRFVTELRNKLPGLFGYSEKSSEEERMAAVAEKPVDVNQITAAIMKELVHQIGPENVLDASHEIAEKLGITGSFEDMGVLMEKITDSI